LLLGDLVADTGEKPATTAYRLFVDKQGTTVLALIASDHLSAVDSSVYTFTPGGQYWTLRKEYRGLALGPSYHLAHVDWLASLDAQVKRHRELVGDTLNQIAISSSDDVVAQWTAAFRRCIDWRTGMDAVVLFEADAMSLAAGDKRAAKGIAKRMTQELPSARIV
jgi:hypothetical protein